jgi:hypothetical protein
MIVWTGWGILVAVIGFGSLVLTELLVESATRDSSFYQTHAWAQAAAIWLAAGLVHLLARFFERDPGRTWLDPVTGEQVCLRAKHSLFFVPMHFWPYILLGLGVLPLFLTK